MGRTFARIVFTLTTWLASGGFLTEGVPAQEPRFYGASHPYLAMAYRNAYAWQSPRAAARFNYNPYFPGPVANSTRRKPFDDVAAFRSRSLSSAISDSRLVDPLDELLAEYRYYGFDYFAEDVKYP